MVKVSKNQLAQIRKLYPNVPVRSTKHSYYISAYGDELQKYIACSSVKLSNRERKRLRWEEIKRFRAAQND